MKCLGIFAYLLCLYTANGFNPLRIRGANSEIKIDASSKRLAIAGLVGFFGFGQPLNTLSGANAAPLRFLPSAEQSIIDDISNFQKPIFELIEQLKPTMQPNPVGVYIEQQILKDGPDDAAVVLLNMEGYIKPVQKKMAEVAPKLDLTGADAERLNILPNLMKGHILELTEAIKKQKASEELKEVEEVQETLAEFLKLASTKYEVEPFKPTRALTDKELFGPLGCEFWGKSRIEGSNGCAPTADEVKAAEEKAGAEGIKTTSGTGGLWSTFVDTVGENVSN